MVKKFIILGKSNTGKSSLVDMIIEDKNLRPIGFRMKDFMIENEFRGYYIHSILDVDGYHNNIPIQTSLKSKKRIQLTEVYDTFGVQCLKDVLKVKKDEYDCIILDELGRGEDTSEEFSKYIRKIIDSDSVVFILMKNVSNSITDEIRKRQDLLIYDLDNMSQEEVISNIKDKL